MAPAKQQGPRMVVSEDLSPSQVLDKYAASVGMSAAGLAEAHAALQVRNALYVTNERHVLCCRSEACTQCMLQRLCLIGSGRPVQNFAVIEASRWHG